MNKALLRGADVVVRQWLNLKQGESLFIVTNENHILEANILKTLSLDLGASVDLLMFEKDKKHISRYFDEQENAFDQYDVILGATPQSLVTTKAVKRAIEHGKRYLSLPLQTDGTRSLLEYEFIMMDPYYAKQAAHLLMSSLNESSHIQVITDQGTNLHFYKRDRAARYFTGLTCDGNSYASSSFEVYIPIEETNAYGVGILDGSLGYIGAVQEPFEIRLENGRISYVEPTKCGLRLKEFIEQFQDDNILNAGEFGIGLNTLAGCNGNSYIEDESAYGTFHIGFGRNLALGGIHEARGHFDLVFLEPTIFIDDKMIMKKGVITDLNVHPIYQRKKLG